MSRRAWALAVALCLADVACGGCPDPQFPTRTATAWSATALVVRWEASPDDSLPDAYYAKAEVKPAPGTEVKSVTVTGVREVTIEVDDLAALRQAGGRLELDVQLPDQRGDYPCHHPGMPDSFGARLTIDISPSTHEATASFGQMRAHMGACAVSGVDAKESSLAPLGLLVAFGALRRRRASRRRADARPSAVAEPISMR